VPPFQEPDQGPGMTARSEDRAMTPAHRLPDFSRGFGKTAWYRQAPCPWTHPFAVSISRRFRQGIALLGVGCTTDGYASAGLWARRPLSKGV
jgi:hypothetical protein